MKVSAQFAAEHFADLVAAASNGEEVEIALAPGKASLRLAISTVVHEPKLKGKRVLGAGRGEFRVPSEEEWHTMDKELQEQMNHGSLFPAELP